MSSLSNEEAEIELEAIKEKYDFPEPDRGNLDDPTIKWRHGRPIYTKANLAFLKGKSKNHSAKSLELLVENLVKTWEMEASHKTEFEQWGTVDHEAYAVSANGGKTFYGEEAKERGNYNTLLWNIENKAIYDSSKESFNSSHDVFRNTFKDGFPWEVLHVLAGPPKVVFTWRHWGIFNGTYRELQGDGQTYEMFGICEVVVNENLKVQSIQVFYKPEEFLNALDGSFPLDELKCGKTIMGDGCPIAH